MMLWQIFVSFLRLGCTSFGGPIAHIGFFRSEFVLNKGWLSERDYFDLVTLCQFLPGPASSQVGMAIGLLRAGYAGALVAWLGFTLPSAILMLALAAGYMQFAALVPEQLLHGLKLAAVAIIAQAVYAMAKSYCTGPRTWVIAILSLLLLSLSASSYWQVLTIGCGALLGLLLVKPVPLTAASEPAVFSQISKSAGLGFGLLFMMLLLGLPIVATMLQQPLLNSIEAFFRAGSLVFGGGHAVLPMLQADFVSSGAVSADSFIAGYGAVQAVPGPLFTFAGFLGASIDPTTNAGTGIHGGLLGGWFGGVVALIAIFTPAFLVLAAVLPFWQTLRATLWMQKAMAGIGASVVAILLSTLYHPVATSTLLSPLDIGLAMLALLALQWQKINPWQLVLLSAIGGGLCAVLLP